MSVLDAAGMAALAQDGAPDEPVAANAGQLEGPVVVTSGDVPMLDAGTLAELVDAHVETGAAVTLLSAEVPDATGYGRIVRTDGSGEVQAIVEEKDATDAQRAITEFNAGIYVFDAGVLRKIGRASWREGALVRVVMRAEW